MKSQDEVIVLTASRSVAGAVTKALEKDNHLVVAGYYEALPDVVSHVAQRAVSVVVVDIDPDATEMLDQLAPVIVRFPRTCFVVLSEESDEETMRTAMEVGVRHLALKDSIDDDLSRALRRLLPRISPDEGAEGELTTVLSTGGGCGATTIAVNLANELRLDEVPSVLLVDMDTSYGSVAAFLNVSGTYGLADIMGRKGTVDIDLVRSSATPCAGGLDVLLSPVAVNPAAPPAVDYGNLGNAIRAFKQAYAHTVIDAPRVDVDVTTALAQASKTTLVVMQLTVKDIRVGQRICSMLIETGMPPERIVPVVSRYCKKDASISINELKRAIGLKEIVLISNDYLHAVRSIDMGEPLALTASRSSLRRDIQKLARALTSAAP